MFVDTMYEGSLRCLRHTDSITDNIGSLPLGALSSIAKAVRKYV